MAKKMENTQKSLHQKKIKLNTFVMAGARATGISRLDLRYHREKMLSI
jgi:hypothetical protein